MDTFLESMLIVVIPVELAGFYRPYSFTICSEHALSPELTDCKSYLNVCTLAALGTGLLFTYLRVWLNVLACLAFIGMGACVGVVCMNVMIKLLSLLINFVAGLIQFITHFLPVNVTVVCQPTHTLVKCLQS